MSKKWQIPVTWEMCGVVTIEADTLEEAIDRANDDDSIELPSGYYVDSSFGVSIDDPDCIREAYNNNQPDDIRNLGFGETVQYAVNIEWDVDSDEDRDLLPTEIEIPDGMEDEDDISDYLSDVSGYCHKGYELVARKSDRDILMEEAGLAISLSDSKDGLFEKLKSILIEEGIEAIEDFLDYEIDPGEDKDIIDRRLDLAFEQMPNDVFYEYIKKYNIVPTTLQTQEERTNPRLESLRDYSKNEETLKMAAEKQQNEKRDALISKIRALAPRIDELIATGNACLQSKIPLTGQAFGMREGYDTNQFFTNSWSHLVGFVGNPHLQPCHIEFLGIDSGGACGVYNFRTNGTDVFSVHEKKPYEIITPSVGHMERFLNSFDTFESSFYAYVDSVIDKQRKSIDKLISSAQEKSDKQTLPSVRRDSQNLDL